MLRWTSLRTCSSLGEASSIARRLAYKCVGTTIPADLLVCTATFSRLPDWATSLGGAKFGLLPSLLQEACKHSLRAGTHPSVLSLQRGIK